MLLEVLFRQRRCLLPAARLLGVDTYIRKGDIVSTFFWPPSRHLFGYLLPEVAFQAYSRLCDFVLGVVRHPWDWLSQSTLDSTSLPEKITIPTRGWGEVFSDPSGNLSEIRNRGHSWSCLSL
ncbi:MAG: hypothetical protein CME26_10395 [Gemmatimonadetes bacterium]|nr:hypothetical protein [Gemmatimonadota bacterium]